MDIPFQNEIFGYLTDLGKGKWWANFLFIKLNHRALSVAMHAEVNAIGTSGLLLNTQQQNDVNGYFFFFYSQIFICSFSSLHFILSFPARGYLAILWECHLSDCPTSHQHQWGRSAYKKRLLLGKSSHSFPLFFSIPCSQLKVCTWDSIDWILFRILFGRILNFSGAGIHYLKFMKYRNAWTSHIPIYITSVKARIYKGCQVLERNKIFTTKGFTKHPRGRDKSIF